MPITKDIQQPTGVIATHHRIDVVTMRLNGEGDKPVTAVVEVGSYLHAEAAARNLQPVATKTMKASFAQPPTVDDLYAWLTAPLEYQEIELPVVKTVDGKLQPAGTTKVQQQVGEDTGFNGAALV